MDWNKLVENRCPRCGAMLHQKGMLDVVRMCTDSHCLFKINVDRFDEIVSNIVSKRRRADTQNYNPDQNLSDLNNL